MPKQRETPLNDSNGGPALARRNGDGGAPAETGGWCYEYTSGYLRVRCRMSVVSEDDARWLYVNLFGGEDYLHLLPDDSAVVSHYFHLRLAHPGCIGEHVLTEVTAHKNVLTVG